MKSVKHIITRLDSDIWSKCILTGYAYGRILDPFRITVGLNQDSIGPILILKVMNYIAGIA